MGEKISKLEVGDFSNLSLLCGLDQADGFDVHALGSGILLILSIIHPATNFIAANGWEHVPTLQLDTDSRHMQPTHQL